MQDNYIVLVFDSNGDLANFKSEFSHRLFKMVVFEDMQKANLIMDQEDYYTWFSDLETLEEFNYCVRSLDWVFGND